MIRIENKQEFFPYVYARYEEVQYMLEDSFLPESLPDPEDEVLAGKNLTPAKLATNLRNHFYDFLDIRVTEVDVVPTVYGQSDVIMGGDIEMPDGTTMWVKVTFSVQSKIDDGQGDTTYIWSWKVHVEADS